MKKILLNFLPLIIGNIFFTTISCETILDDNKNNSIATPPINENDLQNYPGYNKWNPKKQTKLSLMTIELRNDEYIIDITGENLSPFPDSYVFAWINESTNEENFIKMNDISVNNPMFFTLNRVSFKICYSSQFEYQNKILTIYPKKYKSNKLESQFPNIARETISNGKIQYPDFNLTSNDNLWEITKNGTIVKFNGEHTIPIENKTLFIPEYFQFDDMSEKKPITNIAAGAFKGISKIKKIRVPNTIKSIQNGAFFGCDQLEEIEFLPNSNLEYIGVGAFEGTSVKNIKFPKSLLLIDRNAFKDCSQLKNVSLYNSTKYFVDNEIPIITANLPSQSSFEKWTTIKKQI